MGNFDKILERIKEVTDIENMVHLAKTVGTVQSNVSKKRKANIFPAEWAYIIGKKYGLLTEWIMTGEGPKNIGEINSKEIEIISKIEEWIKQAEEKEPGALIWFTYDFRKKYPEFDKWEKRGKDNLSGNISAG
jgi:hypothetical protein